MSVGEREPLIKFVRDGHTSDGTVRKTSAWTKFRESSHLVVGVVFVAMMLDLIVMTSIDPLLPNILHKMDMDSRRNQSSQMESTAVNATESRDTVLLVTTAVPSEETTPLLAGNDASISQLASRDVEERVGIVVALKPATEAVANIAVGALVAKFGHVMPMMCGFLFNTASTLGFAYAPSFPFLVVARVCQAIASSLSVISGLALISCTFQDETTRAKAISTAFGGLSLGIVLGYPFGSITYQFVGRKVPFIGLAVLSLLDGLLRMIMKAKRRSNSIESSYEKDKPTAYMKLLKDPLILSCLACNFAPNVALGVFLATGPAWMLGTLGAQQWEIGCVLTVAIFFQIVTQYLSGRFSTRYGRWKFCLLGMWLYGLGVLVYPHCFTVWMVVVPEILTRSGFGMVICVISPLLSRLVDLRHDSNYGEVFGLYTASYNIGLTVGPLVGGFVINYLSFATLYRGVAIFLFLVSGLCFVLIDPKPRRSNLGSVNSSRGEGSRPDCEEGFHNSIERSYMERGLNENRR